MMQSVRSDNLPGMSASLEVLAILRSTDGLLRRRPEAAVRVRRRAGTVAEPSSVVTPGIAVLQASGALI